MITSTAGIVLRTIKYGDTSGIITIYTRQFGMQSYLINGIRSAGKNYKAHLYQPASILDMEVYHNELKKLQRIKEAKWKMVFKTIFTDILKNAVAVLMTEVMQKSIIAEEQNGILYDFAESQLMLLDNTSYSDAANIPVQFMLKLSEFLGFGIENNYSDYTPFFDLREGKFISDNQEPQTESSILLHKSLSLILGSLKGNKVPGLNGEIRRKLLHLLEKYFQFHVEGFTPLKSLKIMEMILKG